MAKNPNADLPHLLHWNADTPDIRFKKLTFDRCVTPSPSNGFRTIRRTEAYGFVHPRFPDMIWAVCRGTKSENRADPRKSSTWTMCHVSTGLGIVLGKPTSRRAAAVALWNWVGQPKRSREDIEQVLAEKMSKRAAVILSLPI